VKAASFNPEIEYLMAQKKSSRLEPGSAVRVKPGVTLPEFAAQSIAGWTGTVRENQGRGDNLQHIIEWDDATVEAMPQSYRNHCERHSLYFKMVCLPTTHVEPDDSDTSAR
jgi:hypothetical protein